MKVTVDISVKHEYTFDMALYFMRHGESEANVKKVHAGQKDNTASY